MEKQKTVFIINGGGGVGKDTLVGFVARTHKIRNISSVDRVKEIAVFGGWDGVKDNRGRQLLVDLKKAFVAYDDLPFKHCFEQYKEFLKSDERFMFVHIREPQEIEKFKAVTGASTVLVTRKGQTVWGNDRDDNCAEYEYDIVFENEGTVDESGARFVEILNRRA